MCLALLSMFRSQDCVPYVRAFLLLTLLLEGVSLRYGNFSSYKAMHKCIWIYCDVGRGTRSYLRLMTQLGGGSLDACLRAKPQYPPTRSR
jgi:hypothetical protein